MKTDSELSEKKKAVRTKRYFAPALTKGLDILELMASESSGLTLKEIADKLGRSKNEIFRMLIVLEERAYVSLGPNSDVYTLTLKLFSLAHRHSHIKRLSSAANPVMTKLAETIGQSCHLVIAYNGRGIVVAQQDSPTDRCFSVQLGAEAPLTHSCSGHLLLAFSNVEEREQMLLQQSAILKRAFNKAELEKIIERVQVQGYECIKSEQVSAVKDIGYPVFDYSGRMVAALVVPFLEYRDGSHHMDFETAQDYLHQAAMQISSTLGYETSKDLGNCTS